MSSEQKRAHPSGPRVSASRSVEEDTGPLPIRLSVTRGSLGIELSGQASWGQARVRELSLSLLGVSFPVDLSRGVKQFLSHRTQLEVAGIDLDLPDLAARWSEELRELWGETVELRLLPVFDASETRSGADSMIGEGANPRLEGLEVTIASNTGCLVFELLMVGGPEPLLIVDCARSLGEHPFLRSQPALVPAMACVQAGIFALSSRGLEVERQGRVFASSRLAQALCLQVLPAIGLRLPRTDGHVVSEMVHSQGTISLRLGRELEATAASFRVTALLAMARSLKRADSAVLAQRSEEARKEWLSVLETVPQHTLALLELAELDLVHGERSEAALSFLEEAAASVIASFPHHRSRLELLFARALEQTGRRESAQEALSRALSAEKNATFFARLSLTVAKRSDKEQAIQLLTRAVSRAPFDAGVRRERFARLLDDHCLSEAARDAEHWLALTADDESKGDVCLVVARRYEDAGVESETLAWLRRCLRYRPDLPEAQLRLGRALRNGAELERALHLVHSSVMQQEKAFEETSTEAGSRFLAESRLLLSELLVESGQPTAALVQLARIDTRGRSGAAARLMEAAHHQAEGRIDQRDRALLRLVEAVEVGWLSAEDFLMDLQRFTTSAAPPVPERVQQVVAESDRSVR